MTTYRFVACWSCDDGGQWTSQSFCCWTPAPCTLLSGRNDCVPPELADRRIFSKWLGLLMPWNEWLALFQMTGWLLSQHTYSWQRRRHFVQQQRSFVIKRGGGTVGAGFHLDYGKQREKHVSCSSKPRLVFDLRPGSWSFSAVSASSFLQTAQSLVRHSCWGAGFPTFKLSVGRLIMHKYDSSIHLLT